MLSKESKIRVIENFYALDYIFFGKPLKRVNVGCSFCKEDYLSIKGALTSVIIEMIRLVDHSPESLTEKVTSKDVMKNARESAKIARENSKTIVSSQKSRDNIKASLGEALAENNDVDICALTEQKIREKAFKLATDNLLVARIVGESKDFEKLNEWSGKIIEDSYKILRDSLVESANDVLNDVIE